MPRNNSSDPASSTPSATTRKPSAAEVDSRLDQRPVTLVGRHVADETPVDFELVERQALEVCQAGVASAEIVDRDADPQ
jgi:hypothetical protein